MVRCVSVKKKGSTEQCTARPVLGHTLCGRHARATNVKLWSDLHKTSSITRFQALYRGWSVRRYLRLCGPGVLRRKDVINDEDLVTMEDKHKQHPFDYFGIEENGKFWWFDFSTIFTWSLQSVEPVNPYSKTPLPMEARKRLRELWRQKRIRPKDSVSRWNFMCQMFREFGFTDVHPNMFIDIAKVNYYTMFRMIEEDVRISLGDKCPYKEYALRMCRRMIESLHRYDSPQYMANSQVIMMLLMTKPKDPYILIFTILSALYRC